MRLSPQSNQYSLLRYCLMALMLTIANSIAYGQIKYGTIMADSKPVSNAVVENLNSHRVSMSGANGDFIMVMKKGDKIVISAVGLKVDTTIYNDQDPFLIKLKPLPSLLDEVTISERQQSPLDKLYKNQDDYKQIYRIGDDKNMFIIMPGLPFAGLAINLDALYNHFSRAGRNARKLQKTIVRDYLDDVVDSRYTKSLVTKYTGYEGKQLDDFMIDNRPTYEFMRHASDYDIIVFILKAKKSAANKTPDAIAQNDK